jgi:uncharacterized phage protein gp47/JayE
MSYGIQSTGFVVPTLQNITDDLVDAYQAIYGTPNTGSGSVIGFRIGIMAKQLKDAWDALAGVYNAPFPARGDDASFPDIMDLVGLQMLPAAKSEVICQCATNEGFGVPLSAGYLITDPSGNVFALTEAVTIPGGGSIDGVFQAVVAGPVPVDIGTTWTISTQITGWDSVENALAGNVGRLEETVAEARIRRAQSLQVIGASALDAIVARIKNNVPNVTLCRGFENPTDTTDSDGRPPHSIEIMVVGGTGGDIGNALWACKAGGIALTGTASVVVQDSQGNNQTIKFTRPTPVAIAVEVTITRYSEETLPTNYEDLITAAIQEYAATFKTGQDLLIDRWLGPVYAACSGVDKITIRQSKASGGMQTDDIAMAYNEYPEPGAVTVTVVGP